MLEVESMLTVMAKEESAIVPYKVDLPKELRAAVVERINETGMKQYEVAVRLYQFFLALSPDALRLLLHPPKAGGDAAMVRLVYEHFINQAGATKQSSPPPGSPQALTSALQHASDRIAGGTGPRQQGGHHREGDQEARPGTHGRKKI